MHRRLLCRLLFLAGLGSPVLTASAASPADPHDLLHWSEVVPPFSPAQREAWFRAANLSDLTWRVRAHGARPVAVLATGEAGFLSQQRPPFVPKAGRFQGGADAWAVDDGWLVGFNQGEFGAALYWFSPDGRRSQLISDHQVVAFFALADGVHAIEGLAHLGMSGGSVIRIHRPQPGTPWEATPVMPLPTAPYAVATADDGTCWIVLSDRLVALRPDRRLHTALAQAPWGGLYPTSALLMPGQRLYIGMRRYVGEFDLPTGRFRWLSPSSEVLGSLQKEKEKEKAARARKPGG